MSRDLATHAIRIAEELGAPVFPVRVYPDPKVPYKTIKRPLVKSWHRDGSAREAGAIERLFAEHSNATHVGIVTGGASGLLVIDLDGTEALGWWSENSALLPPTRTVRTRRGRHLFYRLPPGIECRCSASKVWSGVDVRASGGYACDWSRDNPDEYLPVAVAPPALIELLRVSKPPAQREQGGTVPVHVPANVVADLRSALAHLRSDDYQVWIAVGQALKELGDVGRGLWIEYGQGSDKWKPSDSMRWDGFKGNRTGYAAVFAKAQAAGWLNPRSKQAGGTRADAPTVDADAYELGWARDGETDLTIDYLIDPWLPRAEVLGVYGRGEAGKSSWCAQLCADVSHKVSTLWISSEERPSWIKQRHLSCRGEPDTLAVVEALPTKIDPETGKAVASTFDVYEHLEGAILACIAEARADRPLGVVVLDAVVALVTWAKGESANDDRGIKRLCARLLVLAEKFGLTVLMLGHVNKGIKGGAANYEYIADAVTGGAAWTNSPRLSFILRKDPAGDFEGHVRTAKSNVGAHFGAHYTTVPVYTLRQRPDGHCDVLCGVQIGGEVVWGEKALRTMMGMDDAEHGGGRRGSRKQRIVSALVDAVLAALHDGPTTTREAVMHKHLLPMHRAVVSPRHWQAADLVLTGAHSVQIAKGTHGINQYARPETEAVQVCNETSSP